MSFLETLATRFVENDFLPTVEQDKIITDAAEYVRSGHQQQRVAGSPAMQLAQSIQPWVSFSNNEGENEGGASIEKTVKAHKFLSRTLKALPAGTLIKREIKVFIGFFCAMYQLPDASISAATEALSSLLQMDNFDASSSFDILTAIGGINHERFTQQLAKTRLEVFKLIDTLLDGPSVQDLQKRHQENEYLPKILGLAGRERDPFNLLTWFRILANSLRRSDLPKDVADAAFDSFSPFFPISIRKSTAPGLEITEDELKDALGACFAANGGLAHRTFPFLLEKLDDGASLTAAAKVDILRTIKACINGYNSVETQVLPYVPRIWSCLKYEVRNGEVPEAIQETLSVFEAVSRRLAGLSSTESLKEFIDTVWNDCDQDFIENQTYTEQLGSILISVARADLASFRLISPRVLTAVTRALAQSKPSSHVRLLLNVLNNLLRARRYVVPSLSTTEAPKTYGDDAIALTRGIYFKILLENAVENPDRDQVKTAQSALEGLSQLVQQRRPSDIESYYTSDCDEDTFQQICSTLTYQCLNAFGAQPASPEGGRADIEKAAADTLRVAVAHYPQGYGKIVSTSVEEINKRNWTSVVAGRSLLALQSTCLRLAFIGCTLLPEDSAALVNFTGFAGGMLRVLAVLFASRANIQTCAYVVDALLKGLQSFLKIAAVRTALSELEASDSEELPWSLQSVSSSVKDQLPSFPDLVTGDFDHFIPTQLAQSMSQAPSVKDETYVVSFLQLGVFITVQLYQHAVTEEETAKGRSLRLSEPLRLQSETVEPQNIWRDRYLSKIGAIAATVLQELSLSAQKDLALHEQIIACFRSTSVDDSPCSWTHHNDDAISHLSWGVANAIRPGIALNLHANIYEILIGDSGSQPVSIEAQAIRGATATLLANKYDTRASTAGEDPSQKHKEWIRVLGDIEKLLNEPAKMGEAFTNSLPRITSILRGAISRADRFITKDLEEAIPLAAAKSDRIHVARELQSIFQPINFSHDDLPPGHIIEKPLYKQRAYHRLVHPILPHAYPLKPESLESVAYAVYVLHAVQGLRPAQYEGDAAQILRIALAATQKAENYEANAALSIVLKIVVQDPKLVQDHVPSVIAASKHVYANASSTAIANPMQVDQQGDASPWKIPAGETQPRGMSVDRATLRRKSVQLLNVLAGELDQVSGRPYARGVCAHLQMVLGDQQRNIRGLAQTAKKTWSQLID